MSEEHIEALVPASTVGGLFMFILLTSVTFPGGHGATGVAVNNNSIYPFSISA